MSRITLDYTPAVHQSAGIGRLTREVVRALLAQPGPHRYRLFCMGGRPVFPPGAEGRRGVLTDRWLHRLWFRARLPIPVQLFSGPCDLYHATDFVLPPLLPGTHSVLTVHDLTFERDPGSAPPTLLTFLKRVVPASTRRAQHIVADSHATAADLTALYGVPEAKITVIHSGVDSRFTPATPAQTFAALREKYRLGAAPYVLAVGTMQRRKNHLGLIRAFARLGPDLAGHQLVIAGGAGWLYDDVVAEVGALGLTGRVRFTGFVDEADLPDLYRAAAVLAFPSFYEGFGLPLLEAMACGVPVVSSSTSSLPEVVGEAGLMVDPRDIDGLSAALGKALTDAEWRAWIIPAGIARAATFTWARAATQLQQVYDRVLNTPLTA